tara:strand:+ start:8480 stop:10765 length:2286 start_codon:yes stop_codon:yes gene_type:complete
MAENGGTSENIRNLELAAKQAALYNDARQDTKDLTRELLLDETKILQAADKRVQIAKTQRDLSRELRELEKDKKNLSDDDYNLAKDNLDLSKRTLKLAVDNNKRIQKTKAGLTSVNNTMRSLVDSAESFLNALPGGAGLIKLFGIDKLADSFTDALNAAGQVFMNTRDIGKSITAFSGTLMGLINPFTILAAIAAGLIAVFINFEKKAKGVAAATGLTLQQSKALVKEAKTVATSFDSQLATSTDILEVQKATVKEFGIANMLSAEQAGNVAEIGKAFGIGAKAAADVTNEFMRMGMTGSDAANALQDVSAEALKAGVSVGTVTADIAANAKNVAKFFGGNVKALQKAAVQAAKLGVSLSTMAKVSEKLLDFENSISSQFEFQALTGKMINFDAARELALRGDIAGATKSILDQVGGIAEFDNMSFLARKKLAEATGMSVDELQKSLTIQSKLGDLTADQQASMANMGLSAAQIKNMSSEELKTRLAQQQATDRLAAGFSAMKDDLTKALIPAGEALVSLFSMLSPILKVIGGTLKIAFLPITIAAKAMQMLLDLARQFSGVTAGILTFTTLIVAKKKEEAILSAANNAHELISNGYTQAKLFLQESLNMAKLKEGAIGVKNMVKTAAEGAMVLGKAIATLFGSFGAIPFGLGIPLAIAAAGGLFAMFSKATSVGDLGIDPNGGPIVASPREGGLFQGTRNDGVSMSPSHGADGGGGGNVAAAIAQTNALLRELISMGTVIEMDGQLVGQVVRTADSFRRK